MADWNGETKFDRARCASYGCDERRERRRYKNGMTMSFQNPSSNPLPSTRTADRASLAVFERALENAQPQIEVVSRRVGGANYQVPQDVSPVRRFTLAVRWIIGAARAKKGKPMAEKLAEELIAASKNEGAAIKKKQDTHRMAEANRAFAHFAR